LEFGLKADYMFSLPVLLMADLLECDYICESKQPEDLCVWPESRE